MGSAGICELRKVGLGRDMEPWGILPQHWAFHAAGTPMASLYEEAQCQSGPSPPVCGTRPLPP